MNSNQKWAFLTLLLASQIANGFVVFGFRDFMSVSASFCVGVVVIAALSNNK